MCDIQIDKTGRIHIRVFIAKKDGGIDMTKTLRHYGILIGILSACFAAFNGISRKVLADFHETTFKPNVRNFVESFAYTKSETDSVVSKNIDPVCRNQMITIQMLKNSLGKDAYHTAKKEVETAGKWE